MNVEFTLAGEGREGHVGKGILPALREIGCIGPKKNKRGIVPLTIMSL